MALKHNDGRDEELEALMHVDGVDTDTITSQINKIKGIKEPQEPIKKEVPKTEPPKTNPVKTDPVNQNPPKTEIPKTEVPNPDAIRAAMLNEMFGEQFKTVEDVKKANIPTQLQELASLRQRATELETQLAKKPKHSFASDDIAMFNEFARETGIKDAVVFNKLHLTDVANMDSMDALVMQHILDNPESANREPQVRRYLERRYNVDSAKIDHKLVDDGEITEEEYQQNKLDYETNLIGINADGRQAKAKLIELKGKIKMPEAPAEEPVKNTKWTPEVESQQKTAWTTINEKMSDEFATIPIMLKGGKEPIINFVLPEESKKNIVSKALEFVVNNQMEVNEANIKAVASGMYSDILMTHQEDIYHAIFERARSITEDEILKVYHNPSEKNTDNPPSGGELTTEEEQRQKAYDLEFGR